MIDIAIVEDDSEIRTSLAVLLQGTEDFSCKRIYDSAESALKELSSQPPDIVLMDINLPGMSGIECVEQLKKVHKDLNILMLTVSDDAADVYGALCAGASGYLMKNTMPEGIIEAVREAKAGGAPMSMDIARMVIESFHKKHYDLTDREKEVLNKICDCKSYKAIAEELFVDINTIKFHIRNIYRKLEVSTKAEAVSKALKEHLT